VNWLPVLPILLPLAAAAGCTLARRRPGLQRTISLTASFLHLVSAVALLAAVSRQRYLVVQLGGWQAPFGISLVADLLASLMLLIAALLGACVNAYAVGSLDRKVESGGFHTFYQVLLAGVSGAFLTGDIFNLYVLFEVLLISSFALMAVGGDGRQTAGAVKYVTVNLLASFLFLMAVGLLYRHAGTLNMAALARALPESDPQASLILAVLFLIAFGIKAAAFPLFFWLPDSYPYPPVAITAIFAALLTKVGVYALLRVFTLLFVQHPGFTQGIILASAGFTMLTGVLGAAYHKEIRSILSFHIISQIGYMLMGLGLHTLLGLSGAIYFVFHNILAKSNLFLVAGIVHRMQGSFALSRLGDVLGRSPAAAALFLIPALSLAGIPPLSGFVGKYMLVKAGLDGGRWMVSAVALAVGLLTLFSMTKIWNHAFLEPPPQGDGPGKGTPGLPETRIGKLLLWGPPSVLAALTVAIGVGAEPVLAFTHAAAGQLLDRDGYVRAVLGGR
jgi:multicomponent Na+:H+ antiporter subunit D